MEIKHASQPDVYNARVAMLQKLANETGTPRQPDFFGIGSEKCGTTWLWEMFRGHPEIGVPFPKELRYFSNRYLGTRLVRSAAIARLLDGKKGLRLDRLATELRLAVGDDDAYLRIFGALSGDVVGDITPQYCMLPHEGIAHMQRISPDARIIMLLRDPVARAISGGKMKAADGNNTITDALIRRSAMNSFQIGMSRYSTMLDKFEAAFPHRVFIGFMDDIATRPLEFLDELCSFLGVKFSKAHFPQATAIVHEGKKHNTDPELQCELYRLLAGEYDLLETRFPERVAEWREKYIEL